MVEKWVAVFGDLIIYTTMFPLSMNANTQTTFNSRSLHVHGGIATSGIGVRLEFAIGRLVSPSFPSRPVRSHTNLLGFWMRSDGI